MANDSEASKYEIIDAAKSSLSWLKTWAIHAGSCKSEKFCTCGLAAVRSELEFAISSLEHDV